MRDIIYRGKRLDTGEWVYGGISIFGGEATIYNMHEVNNAAYDVDIDTVGEFTGLHDRNGKEIFESDKMKKPGSDNIYTVVFFDGAFYLKNGGVNHRLSWTTNDGEIIDNPELLKGGTITWRT